MVKFGTLPTEADYYFQAQVKKLTVPRRIWVESAKNFVGHAPIDVAILIPQMSSGMERFLSAWLPVDASEAPEVALFLQNPIYMPARASLHRPNAWCKRPYMLLMGEDSSKDTLKYDGQMVEVKAYSEKEFLKQIEESTPPSADALYFSKVLKGEQKDG